VSQETGQNHRWAVFFDLEGTLIVRATRLEEVVETVLFAHDRVRSPDVVRQAVENVVRAGTEAGAKPPRSLYAQVFRALALDDEAERLATEVWEACQRIDPPVLAPGAPAAIELLRGAGAVLGVITNADGAVRDTLGRMGLARYFEVVMTPSRAGATKPDRRIFQAALAEAGVPAESAWHVGDDPVGDARGAKDAGLSPVLLLGSRGGGSADGFLHAARIDEAAALILKRQAEKQR
jgi:putative hydrolase of the HAD superfamily